MTCLEFETLIRTTQQPVILLAGMRELPDIDRGKLVRLGILLASRYQHALFRTGNAKGSDCAFAAGVCRIDSSRMQYVLPYSGFGPGKLHPSAYQVVYPEVPLAAQKRAEYETTRASPDYLSLLERAERNRQARIKSIYLLRDALMATGDTEVRLAPVTVGIFYVNVDDPMKGGTGHTIRVCTSNDVPVVYQHEWMRWLPALAP